MCILTLLLIALSAAAADHPQVAVTQLDGTVVSGRLVDWRDGYLTIDDGTSQKVLQAEQLLSVAASDVAAATTLEEAASAYIELTDGSRIPIDSFELESTAAAIHLPNSPPNREQVNVERKQTATVLLRPLADAAIAQWQEIRDLDLASDVLVVQKRNGESLDYVEGVVRNVSPETVEFEMDGDALRVDVAKVAGLLLYQRSEAKLPDTLFRLTTRTGLQANVAEVAVANNELSVTTTAGVTLQVPLASIASADFSAGKLMFLSDLKPALEKWTPLVGLPADASLAAKNGLPRRNQAAYGGPLTLMMPDSASLEAPRTFAKGLALRSRTELVYRLPAGFNRFLATAGIDPATRDSGDVRLEIYGDDRPVFEASVTGGSAALPIDVDIANVKQLKIVVDYANNLDTGDWLNLCEARILK